MVKFSKFCSESFHRLTDRHCWVQILWNVANRKLAKSCVIYQTKKFRLPLKLSLLCQLLSKSARANPQQCTQECSRFHPNRFTFSRVIAERMNTAKLPCKVNLIVGWSLASIRIIKHLSFRVTYNIIYFFRTDYNVDRSYELQENKIRTHQEMRWVI